METLMKNMKKMSKKVTVTEVLMMLFFAWFIITFLVYPNLNTIVSTFFKNGRLNFEPVQKLFSSKRAVQSLLNSFLLACSLVVTVNIVGVTIVLITDYFKIAGAKILKLGYFTTLVYSGVVLVSGYKLIYGEMGFMTKLIASVFPAFNTGWFEGYWAVLFVMTFACTSNHILFLSTAMKKVDYQTVEAAKSMGASQFYILRRVVLPTLKPTLFALTILTFLTGLGATSAPLILGGESFQTITPMILNFSKSASSRDLATILALILGLATFILLIFMINSERKGNFMSISKVKSELQTQPIQNPIANILIHVIAYVLFAIYMIPVILIILFSFTDSLSITTGTLSLSSFTLSNYAEVFSSASALSPYIVSITYAFVGSLLVVILCLCASKLIHKYNNKLTTLLEFGLLIPWIIPGTLIAMGLIVTFNEPQALLLNRTLAGSVLMLLIGYILVKIPFTLRMTKSVFFSIDSEMEEAAQNMGASAFYTFRRVILPLILPAVLGVFALNFISILPDYDLTVFLYQPLFKPLGIVIKNSTDPQALGDARAMSLVYTVILMIISTVVLTFVYGDTSKWRKKMKNNPLNIGTYNIRFDTDEDGQDAWKFRKQNVLSIIEKYKFDLLGLQEVRPTQLAFFAENTPYKIIGKGRTDDELTEYNPILYNETRLELLEQDTFWLSETPNEISKYKDADCVRICTWGRFVDRATEQQIIFMNTHLDHISSEARAFGMQAILQYVQEHKWNDPVVIVGDFNAGAEENWFEKVMDSGYQNTRDSSVLGSFGPKGTCTGVTFQHDLPLEDYQQIDYIFASQGIQPEIHMTITDTFGGKYPSDHLPLLCKMLVL